MVSKWWSLRRAQKETIKFAPEFSQFLEEDNLTEAINLAESYKKSHVALVLGGALGEVKPLIQDGSVTVADINSAERAVERNMLLEITNLKRGLAVLATVGATAPFVGLLGTTMGIVNAFQGMAVSGSGGLASIGGGISEALITTAFGLIVAIPAVWAYNYFTTKIDNLTAEMTYVSKEMIDYLIKGVSGEFGRSRFTREFNASTSAGAPDQAVGSPLRLRSLAHGFLATKRGQRSEHAQRDADDRRHVGAPDHLHGGHAGIARRLQRHPARRAEHQGPSRGFEHGSGARHRQGRALLLQQEADSRTIRSPPTIKAIYSQPDRDDYILYLKADKDLDYEKVLDAMDIAAKNGVRVVAMIGDQKPNTVSTVPGDSKDAPAAPGGGSN